MFNINNIHKGNKIFLVYLKIQKLTWYLLNSRVQKTHCIIWDGSYRKCYLCMFKYFNCEATLASLHSNLL